MHKVLRACVLVVAIACTVQAGEMQNGLASQTPETAGEMQNGSASQIPDTGTAILIFLEHLLF
jgi:hypothetical protein